MKNRNFGIFVLLVGMLFFGTTATIKAQTYYALQIDRNIRFQAIDLTAEYQPYLVMGTDQALDFQQTLARFLVKKKSVEEDPTLSYGAKYSLLKKLSNRETAEMGQVLENYRWREYMRIKPSIQPLPKPPSKKAYDAIADIDATN
ncbi:hypothetical protein [Cytophaga sp. FL35]|uniref:hypothetical protein n=1 Tax=Cytophaga sp. FL35 TaxID=1904456 RepID=UPI0016537BF7|nr:hypothetical protein [Cytophaga sp. FL35]MBC6998382.1 hypothetical protein [Cytophaga sp. FL35]